MAWMFFGLGAFMDAASVYSSADVTRARSLQVDMLLRILEGGLVLRDVDEVSPTRWGHWNPHDLNENATWSDERGLNLLRRGTVEFSELI